MAATMRRTKPSEWSDCVSATHLLHSSGEWRCKEPTGAPPLDKRTSNYHGMTRVMQNGTNWDTYMVRVSWCLDMQ